MSKSFLLEFRWSRAGLKLEWDWLSLEIGLETLRNGLENHEARIQMFGINGGTIKTGGNLESNEHAMDRRTNTHRIAASVLYPTMVPPALSTVAVFIRKACWG